MEQHEFGAAVRQLRESTPPETVGLPAGARRTRGLRREELGELAGMSADYVRRLEQGRSHPSAGVVKAIARAVRAGRADYERLCALAGYAAADGHVPTAIGPGATRLLERFTDTPMFVSDAAMNLVAVNSAFLALGHWDLPGERWDWNIAWRTFCQPFRAFQQAPADAADHEAVLVVQLRSAVLRYPTDRTGGSGRRAAHQEPKVRRSVARTARGGSLREQRDVRPPARGLHYARRQLTHDPGR